MLILYRVKTVNTLLSSANTSFKKDLEQFIEALGIEFLDIIQDEIINNENFDTGALINSYTKSEKGNIWVLGNSSYSITLEIGSELDYAGFVNDGHWTNKKGELGRWIPGTWNGDRFEYTPNAKTGMYSISIPPALEALHGKAHQ